MSNILKRNVLLVGLLLSSLMISDVAATPPLCPTTTSDIASLNPWTACVVTILLTRTPEQINQYLTSNEDEQCIAEKNSCAAAAKFNQCQTTTSDLMQFIVPEALQSSSLVQCPNFFKAFPEFCSRPFGELVSVYCPPGPLLPIPAIVGIAVGGLAMVLLVIYVCRRTKHSILLDKEIEAAITFAGPSTMPIVKGNQVIQSSANPAAYLPQKSEYYGVVWNRSEGGWDAIYETPSVREWLGTFSTEEQAARKYDARVAQLQQAGVTKAPLNFPKEQSESPLAAPGYGGAQRIDNPSIAPPPGLGFSVQMSTSKRGGGYDDPNREKHIQDLIQFYQYYDPERPDIEAHVLSLFEKYNFRGIARAMLRKYGVLPSGWEFEYDATRSVAMSMAARLFHSPSASGQGIALPPQQSVGISREREPMPNF